MEIPDRRAIRVEALANAVAQRKEKEAVMEEFEENRMKQINKLKDIVKDDSDTARQEIFKLIFSPLSANSYPLIDPDRKCHHMISDSINIDLGIWKLVSANQWDEIKRLHRPALEEFCPVKFRHFLVLILNLIIP
jgi:hypothetical protein